MRNLFNWSKVYRYSFRPSAIVYYVVCHLYMGGMLLLALVVQAPALLIILMMMGSVILWLRMLKPGYWNEHMPSRHNYLASISTVQPPRTITLPDWVPKRTDQQMIACADGGVWRYADFRYAVEYAAKAKLRAEYRYFSVLQIDLPRKLPAMLFLGGYKGHGHNFEVDGAQRTSLEGNFDDHFETYFPYHYHIDARSIISPEVMIEMLGMTDCDIEIQDNTMYFYFCPPKTQDIYKYINQALRVREKLVDHIIHYRDERLQDMRDRQNVAQGAVKLRGSGLGYLSTFFITAALTVAGVFIFLAGPDEYTNVGEWVMMSILTPVWGLLTVWMMGAYIETVIENKNARKRPPRQ